jgi:hypothetical protein
LNQSRQRSSFQALQLHRNSIEVLPVLYYRASVRDTTANDIPAAGGGFLPQDSMVCKRVGPTLQLFGNFPIAEGDFLFLKDGME